MLTKTKGQVISLIYMASCLCIFIYVKGKCILATDIICLKWSKKLTQADWDNLLCTVPLYFEAFNYEFSVNNPLTRSKFWLIKTIFWFCIYLSAQNCCLQNWGKSCFHSSNLMLKIERFKKWIQFFSPHEACRYPGKMGKVKKFDKGW